MQTLMTGAKTAALLRLLTNVVPLDGNVCELGVYEGGTLLSLAKAAPGKKVYGFDTFDGMPTEPWRAIDFHKPGEFKSNFEDVARAMPKNVTLVRGIFPGSAQGSTFDGLHFCFAHVDMDLEKSTEDAIDWLRPRMAHRGIVVFDDYHWKNCPGVAKAIERAGLPVKVSAPNQCYWIAP